MGVEEIHSGDNGVVWFVLDDTTYINLDFKILESSPCRESSTALPE